MSSNPPRRNIRSIRKVLSLRTSMIISPFHGVYCFGYYSEAAWNARTNDICWVIPDTDISLLQQQRWICPRHFTSTFMRNSRAIMLMKGQPRIISWERETQSYSGYLAFGLSAVAVLNKFNLSIMSSITIYDVRVGYRRAHLQEISVNGIRHVHKLKYTLVFIFLNEYSTASHCCSCSDDHRA